MTRLWCSVLLFVRSLLVIGAVVTKQGNWHPRSEIDLTTEKQVLFCAGQNKSLECVSPGSTIAIMDAFWGRLSQKICPSEDGDPSIDCGNDHSTTPILKKLCDNKVFCEIPARHTVLQNPGTSHCPGVNKYLIVNYTCVPVERKLVLCDGETTNLQCGEGWKLDLMDAFWGRLSPTTCATTFGRPSRIGNCDSWNNTLSTVKQICQGNQRCIIRADPGHMAQGREHCPDVDKYAMLRYRCHPNVDNEGAQALETAVIKSPTVKITNNVEVQKLATPPMLHIPTLMQVTKPDASASQISHHRKSIDNLLQEYMDSQRPGDQQEEAEINIPHDTTPTPPLKEKIQGVPQDSPQADLKQDIALLKQIIHSKQLMKVGKQAMKGINEARARTHASFDKDEAAKNVNNGLQLHLSEDEVRHLTRSPDAIKFINDFMEREKHRKMFVNISETSSPENGIVATPTPTSVIPLKSTQSPSPSKLPIKALDPTAKLGGKIMGNLLYEKYLKPTQDEIEKQVAQGNTVKNTQMSVLKKKISALQAISDALKVITSKIEDEDNKGQNQNVKFVGPHFDVGSLEISEHVDKDDIKFLQDKINRAIETTEEMSRQETRLHPELMALHLKGKAHLNLPGTTRDIVLSKNEKLQIDNEIKDIEDSFNDFIERAEKSGKLKGINLSSKPTESLYHQLQSGQFKMMFDDENAKKPKNKVNGVEGFEVDSEEPIINVITDKDVHTKNTTVESPTSRSTQINPAKNLSSEIQASAQTSPVKNLPTVNQASTSSAQAQTINHAQTLTKLPKTTVNKAANSIANAIRRQGTNKTSYVALMPITTFHNIENKVTLGGRINSEVVSEKKKAEGVYHGKDIKTLLNVLNVKPTTKAPSLSIKVVNNADNGQPKTKQTEQNPSMSIKVLNGTKPSDDKGPVAEVKTVGKLDESTMKLLSIVVQGYLDHTKRRHHRRRRKHHRLSGAAEPEGFMVGAKHDEVNSREVKKKVEGRLLDILEDQLQHSQNPVKIGKLMSDAVQEDFTEGEDVKSVPNDREIDHEEEQQDVMPDLTEEIKKPMSETPTDMPSATNVDSYTSSDTTETISIDKLVKALKKMIEETKASDEKANQKGRPVTKPITLGRVIKPHLIQFNGASTSGKIGTISAGEEPSNNQTLSQGVFTGGRISPDQIKPILKPVSQDALAAINMKPTTKSSVGTAAVSSSASTDKLRHLVSGVKRLLKALRGSVANDIKDDDHEEKHFEEEKKVSDYDDNVMDTGKLPTTNYPFKNYYFKEKMFRGNSDITSYRAPFKSSYDYGEQYDLNLARQYANPKEYASIPTDLGSYSSYTYQPQPSPFSLGAYPNPPSYSDNLPKGARHALKSALSNDPILQAVEEFSNNESRLYNEKLRGIQRKGDIPRHQKTRLQRMYKKLKI